MSEFLIPSRVLAMLSSSLHHFRPTCKYFFWYLLTHLLTCLLNSALLLGHPTTKGNAVLKYECSSEQEVELADQSSRMCRTLCCNMC